MPSLLPRLPWLVPTHAPPLCGKARNRRLESKICRYMPFLPVTPCASTSAVFDRAYADSNKIRLRPRSFKFAPRVACCPLFHDVQQEHLLLGRHLGDVVFVVATRIERLVEGLGSITQRIAVCRIGRWYGRDRFCQIA